MNHPDASNLLRPWLHPAVFGESSSRAARPSRHRRGRDWAEGGNYPECAPGRLWWCIILDGHVWSRHRTQAAANRAADRIDRKFCDATSGSPPVLAWNAEVGDPFEELEIVEEGSRA